MNLSIIIVNWKSATLLKACLKSVLLNDSGLDYEVLVIDNASYDGSAKFVATEFPSVSFIQSSENSGFAGGNNRAFQQAQGRNILFLNPDTEIVGDALQKMLNVLAHYPDAGVVGPKLVNPDLSIQIDCMRAFPRILNQMFDAALSRRILSNFDFWGVKSVLQDCDVPVSVEMLPGTCVMIRRETFEAAGRFSEEYFMYAEDVELSYKVKKAGWTNYYLSSAQVIHHGGKSSSQKSENHFSTVMMRESVWKFLCRNRGKAYARFYRVTTMIAALARISVLCLVYIMLTGSPRRFYASKSLRKWKMVLRWSAGLESWARQYKPVSLTANTAQITSVQAS